MAIRCQRLTQITFLWTASRFRTSHGVPRFHMPAAKQRPSRLCPVTPYCTLLITRICMRLSGVSNNPDWRKDSTEVTAPEKATYTASVAGMSRVRRLHPRSSRLACSNSGWLCRTCSRSVDFAGERSMFDPVQKACILWGWQVTESRAGLRGLFGKTDQPMLVPQCRSWCRGRDLNPHGLPPRGF